VDILVFLEWACLDSLVHRESVLGLEALAFLALTSADILDDQAFLARSVERPDLADTLDSLAHSVAFLAFLDPLVGSGLLASVVGLDNLASAVSQESVVGLVLLPPVASVGLQELLALMDWVEHLAPVGQVVRQEFLDKVDLAELFLDKVELQAPLVHLASLAPSVASRASAVHQDYLELQDSVDHFLDNRDFLASLGFRDSQESVDKAAQ